MIFTQANPFETESVFTGRRWLTHVTTSTDKLDISIDFLHGNPTRIMARNPATGMPVLYDNKTLTGVDQDVEISGNRMLTTLYIIEAQKQRIKSCKTIELVFEIDDEGLYLSNESYRQLEGLTKRPFSVSDLIEAVTLRQNGVPPENPTPQEKSPIPVENNFWTENAAFVTRCAVEKPVTRSAAIVWPQDPEPNFHGVTF